MLVTSQPVDDLTLGKDKYIYYDTGEKTKSTSWITFRFIKNEFWTNFSGFWLIFYEETFKNCRKIH